MKKEKQLYKIYIDSSQRYEKSVCLFRLENTSKTEIAKKTGDIDIPSAIKELLVENSVSLNEVSEIVPNLGPGSFTGLKIGVTVANVKAWALGKKDINELYLPNYGKEPNIELKKF